MGEYDGRDLRNADLRGWDLDDTSFVGADLRGANLAGASLVSSSLTDADLSGADLSGANLNLCELTGADLSHVLADGANFYCADLTGACLAGASLRGASLCAATLVGADLSGSDLTGSESDDETEWPDDYSPAGAADETLYMPGAVSLLTEQIEEVTQAFCRERDAGREPTAALSVAVEAVFERRDAREVLEFLAGLMDERYDLPPSRGGSALLARTLEHCEGMYRVSPLKATPRAAARVPTERPRVQPATPPAALTHSGPSTSPSRAGPARRRDRVDVWGWILLILGIAGLVALGGWDAPVEECGVELNTLLFRTYPKGHPCLLLRTQAQILSIGAWGTVIAGVLVLRWDSPKSRRIRAERDAAKDT